MSFSRTRELLYSQHLLVLILYSMGVVEVVGGEAAGVGGDKEGEVEAAWMSINATFLFITTGTHLIPMYGLFSYQLFR